MFNVDNEDYKTIFIGKNEDGMYNLLNHLKKNNFDVLIKVSLGSSGKTFSHLEPPYPMYYIKANKDEQEEALNEGILYASSNNLDDVICAYPNLDFDTIGNIKERENSLSK